MDLEPKGTPLLAGRLAEFASALSYERIPSAVLARAKHLMLDALGIAFASTGFDFAHRSLSALRALSGAGEVPVIGFGECLSLRDAALLDGILIHGLDYDDTHSKGVVHLSASQLPTVLCLGAHRHESGKEALAAYVAGVEAASRLGAVAKGGFHQVGFHPTGLVGAFGSALAAGKLMGLTQEQLVMAQGIALSAAAGSLEFLEDGAWTKRFHAGWAAQCGITAAALAQQGFVGARRAYEGRFGLYRSHLQERFCEQDLALADKGLGQVWEVMEVAVKPFPACHFTHASIDAAIALGQEERFDPSLIERVTALLPAEVIGTVCEPQGNKKRPKNPYDAQFSIPFLVASALLRGRFTLAELSPEAIRDPEILALADRVQYEIDPDSGFPRCYSGEVCIETKDGRRSSKREAINRGSSEKPLSEEEIEKKFHDNAGRALAPEKAREIARAILSLEEAGDLMVLARTLSGG